MRLWSTKVEVWLLSTLPPTGSALQRLLERWTYQTPRWVFDGSTPGAPTGSNERLCIRTHPCHGATARTPALSGRDRPPRQRCPRRQPPMESGTLGPSVAARNSRSRRNRLGNRDSGALLGHRRTSNNPQRRNPESSWRWRESNPRPRTTGWVFYGRSRRIDLASGLPPAEDPSAIPASMSGGGRQAEPPSSACSRRPTRGRRRPAADGHLVPRQRVPAQSWQLFHPGF